MTVFYYVFREGYARINLDPTEALGKLRELFIGIKALRRLALDFLVISCYQSPVNK